MCLLKPNHYAVLINIDKMTRSQLVAKLGNHSLCTQHEVTTHIRFDVNDWGETITAPHVRRPPLQKETVKLIIESVKDVRRPIGTAGNLAEDDFYFIIDGGRETDSFLQDFGFSTRRSRKDESSAAAVPSTEPMRKASEGKTIQRTLTIYFTELSVKSRKHRKKKNLKGLKCSQRCHIFYSGKTHNKEHVQKYFSAASNLSDMMGPFELQPWSEMLHLPFGEKKHFGANAELQLAGRPLMIHRLTKIRRGKPKRALVTTRLNSQVSALVATQKKWRTRPCKS